MEKELTESKWSPTSLWTPAMICLIALMIIKLLCLSTIFGDTGSLSRISTYVYAIWASFVLNIPEGLFRKRWLQVFIMLAIDIVAIFMSSGHHAVWILTSLTLLAALLCLKLKDTSFVPKPGIKQYCGYLCVWTLTSGLLYFFT